MDLRTRATVLRKKGNTYSEIATRVPVSKATLSIWLRDVPLPVSYHEKIAKLKLKAREKGWEARRFERRSRTARIEEEAKKEVASLLAHPLWVTGLTLYWAEGSKEKPWGKGTPVTFTNMDPETLVVFKSWCLQFLKTESSDFDYSLYIHDSQTANAQKFQEWWASRLGIPAEDISIYYKRTRTSYVRKNDNEHYKGVFRLQIRKSVDLTRKITGWIQGLTDSLKHRNFVK